MTVSNVGESEQCWQVAIVSSASFRRGWVLPCPAGRSPALSTVHKPLLSKVSYVLIYPILTGAARARLGGRLAGAVARAGSIPPAFYHCGPALRRRAPALHPSAARGDAPLRLRQARSACPAGLRQRSLAGCWIQPMRPACGARVHRQARPACTCPHSISAHDARAALNAGDPRAARRSPACAQRHSKLQPNCTDSSS